MGVRHALQFLFGLHHARARQRPHVIAAMQHPIHGGEAEPRLMRDFLVGEP